MNKNQALILLKVIADALQPQPPSPPAAKRVATVQGHRLEVVDDQRRSA